MRAPGYWTADGTADHDLPGSEFSSVRGEARAKAQGPGHRRRQ